MPKCCKHKHSRCRNCIYIIYVDEGNYCHPHVTPIPPPIGTPCPTLTRAEMKIARVLDEFEATLTVTGTNIPATMIATVFFILTATQEFTLTKISDTQARGTKFIQSDVSKLIPTTGIFISDSCTPVFLKIIVV